MPLKTFRNLPESRRREIIDTCLEEFMRHGYQGASLSRIIRRLGLAKGSFYRYFESKKSLYTYLIEYATSFTVDILQDAFQEPVKDILAAWVRFYLACARQDNAYPLLGYFGYRIALDKNNLILGDVPSETLKQGTILFKDLFLRHQREGRIRSDMDAELMIFILLKLQSGFVEYLNVKHDVDFEDNIRRGRPLFPLPEATLKKELEAFAQIMREGFQSGTEPESKGENHAK